MRSRPVFSRSQVALGNALAEAILLPISTRLSQPDWREIKFRGDRKRSQVQLGNEEKNPIMADQILSLLPRPLISKREETDSPPLIRLLASPRRLATLRTVGLHAGTERPTVRCVVAS